MALLVVILLLLGCAAAGVATLQGFDVIDATHLLGWLALAVALGLAARLVVALEPFGRRSRRSAPR